MRARVVEGLTVSALAMMLTAVIAAPVLWAPSERLFGRESAGRHHDPFTAMQQFEQPVSLGVFSQPVTDVTGAWLARVAHPVAAYNWLVLLSFPLSALAAYLLARHLSLSPPAATMVAFAYAFSPFHIAHAAYHPHIAQTQWIPLYLLALWRCLDRVSPISLVCLAVATITVTLSNFYGGLIAAAITPVAIAAYWLVRFPLSVPVSSSTRRLCVTVATLALLAVTGISYVSYAASAVIDSSQSFAFPRADLFTHSAHGWSYLVPPIGHPLLGATSDRLWKAAGVHDGLLEQQVSLGWGVVTLALVAVIAWLVRTQKPTSLVFVPALAVIASAALVCSLSPEVTIGSLTFRRPSAFFYDVMPMFRAYARFGVVVQLMAALLAGIGLEQLWRVGKRAQIVGLALVAAAAAEYAVSPATLWRDVLPTTAHRWVMQQADHLRVLDCTPLNQESASVEWLTGSRVLLPGGLIADCTAPDLPQKLAANGLTHLLVRRDAVDLQSFAPDHPLLDGLQVVARFADAQLFAVAADAPIIQTRTMRGFSAREHNAEWAWRWMGTDAGWAIVNTAPHSTVATLTIEMSAFHRARRMTVLLDGHPVHTLVVEPSRRIYEIGPLTLAPGDHELAFAAVEAPTIARAVIDNGDARALSFAFGTWNWTLQGGRP